MGRLKQHILSRKGYAYKPISASVSTAPTGPALPVPCAPADPTAVPFWLDVFDSKNSDPRPEGQEICSEEAAGNISCNHI